MLNADDEFLPLWRGMTRARVVTFGQLNAADFSAADVRTAVGADGFVTQFELRAPQGQTPIELRLAGGHNVQNALCAAAAAVAAGASLADVRAGLATMRPVPGRLQLKTAPPVAPGSWTTLTTRTRAR